MTGLKTDVTLSAEIDVVRYYGSPSILRGNYRDIPK
jgi:hypothetical protein